jgi:hypothetical protein
MDEQPREPVERREVVERHETVERPAGTGAPEPAPRRRSYAWVWVTLLAVLIALLAWYALSRGEPQQIEMPELGTPDIEVQAPE